MGRDLLAQVEVSGGRHYCQRAAVGGDLFIKTPLQ